MSTNLSPEDFTPEALQRQELGIPPEGPPVTTPKARKKSTKKAARKPVSESAPEPTIESAPRSLLDAGGFSPEDLAPERGVPPELAEYWFWVGLRADYPTGGTGIHAGGLGWPIYVEVLTKKDPRDPSSLMRQDGRLVPHTNRNPGFGSYIRTSKRGQIIRLSREKVDSVLNKIRRCIVRTIRTEQIADPNSDRTGAIDIYPVAQKRKVALISVPTKEDWDEQVLAFKERRTRMRPRPFVPVSGDEPIANFLYLVFLGGETCEPRAMDTPTPDPLSVTGFKWPEGDLVPAIADNLLGR